MHCIDKKCLVKNTFDEAQTTIQNLINLICNKRIVELTICGDVCVC